MRILGQIGPLLTSGLVNRANDVRAVRLPAVEAAKDEIGELTMIDGGRAKKSDLIWLERVQAIRRTHCSLPISARRLSTIARHEPDRDCRRPFSLNSAALGVLSTMAY